jgi:predicted nucleotidyltransferase
LVEVVRDALSPLQSRIAVAFVHGSVAVSQERASSDVDLIVIGAIGLAKLAPVLDALEERLGRSVNASVFTAEEFSKKLAAKNHFLRAVLQKERLFILGTGDDLERIARRSPR